MFNIFHNTHFITYCVQFVFNTYYLMIRLKIFLFKPLLRIRIVIDIQRLLD
jgi:hypothetical protein